MTDVELHALACFVHAQAMQHKAYDDARLAEGGDSYWDDASVTGQTELETELERREVIALPKEST